MNLESKAGARISKKAFIQSILILFVIMVIDGGLTKIVPAGEFNRIADAGRVLIEWFLQWQKTTLRIFSAGLFSN